METGRGPRSHRTVEGGVHEQSELRAADADTAARRVTGGRGGNVLRHLRRRDQFGLL